MNLKDISAISGEPGLFKFIAQGKNAIIVEHLRDKKKKQCLWLSKSKFSGRYCNIYGERGYASG